jgi:hypothetical protein
MSKFKQALMECRGILQDAQIKMVESGDYKPNGKEYLILDNIAELLSTLSSFEI